jgi:hypothetical protein
MLPSGACDASQGILAMALVHIRGKDDTPANAEFAAALLLLRQLLF